MKTYIRAIVGVTIGALLLWLSVRNLDLNEIRSAARQGAARTAFHCACVYWLALGIRVFRWRALLSGIGQLSLGQVGRALILGYAANNVLPARLGELYRVDFVRRQYGLARSAVLGSVIVERLEDAIAALALLTLGLTFATRSTENSALVYICVLAGGIIASGVLAAVLFGLWHERLLRERFPWLRERVAILMQSLKGMSAKLVSQTAAMTVAIWAGEAIALGLVISAFGVYPTPAGLALILGAAALSTLIPSSPGYVGSLQAAFVLAFMALGLEQVVGILSATAMQIVLLGSVTLAGLFVLLAGHFRGLVSIADAEYAPFGKLSGRNKFLETSLGIVGGKLRTFRVQVQNLNRTRYQSAFRPSFQLIFFPSW